jgi:hypothetical protein
VSGRAREGALYIKVVSERISCLYISGKRNEEGKKSTLIHVKVVSERETFFAFCSREEEKISPCCRGEKDNHLIQRIGETREEEGDKPRIQRWKGRYMISERD